MMFEENVDMVMAQDVTWTAERLRVGHHLAPKRVSWNSDDKFGLVCSVPQLDGIYHVDKLQRMTDRDNVPGMVVFTAATKFGALVTRHEPHVNRNYAEIEAQVTELRVDAREEREAFNEDSAVRLLAFCREVAADHEPAVFLLRNGNLRAVWQNAACDQVGIQFFPDGVLQYVILRDWEGKTLKALGEDIKTDNIIATVRLQGLLALWYHGQG